MTTDSISPPAFPPAWEDRVGRFLLRALAPRLRPTAPAEPPEHLAPFERFAIPVPGGAGRLAATWYPAAEDVRARGAVLLVHPWLEWGQAYFHRHGRLEALRAAGYHALTFDLSGVGASPGPCELSERDVAAAFAALRERAPGLPLHLWGISAGGYWSHFFLARTEAANGAVFEDVSPHLLEWSRNVRPSGRPAYALFQRLIPRMDRFLDARGYAPSLRVRAAAYIGGEKDVGVPPEVTRELARLAGAESLIVPGAGHLAAIKVARQKVLELALRTFERATAASQDPARSAVARRLE